MARRFELGTPQCVATNYLLTYPFAYDKAGQAGMDANESVSDQEEEDFLEAETYVLPLGACHGEEAEARRTGEYQLPIECQVGDTLRFFVKSHVDFFLLVSRFHYYHHFAQAVE